MSKVLPMAGASRVAWTRQQAADAYSLHAARVERAAARILRDRDEARDVASETFLALLEGGPDDRQATESWLLTTARNRALNRLRERERAERTARHLAASSPAVEPAAGPAEASAHGLVTEAASLIGERERTAVHLRFTEDRSYDEIASRLGVSPGNARVVVHRALRRLRSGAVALLADRHGASERCRRELLRGASNGGVRAHHGCSPCTAVSDELAAMTASGLLPVALPAGSGLLARMFDAPIHVLSRLRNPASGRTAEALAALLVTGTVGLGTPAPTPLRVEPASITVTAPGTRSLAATVSRAGESTVRTVKGATAPRQDAPGLVAPDAAGDNQPVPKDLVPIGMPLVLRDASESASARGLDIRRFEVVRLGDAAGKTAGLLFRFGLDAPPRPQAEYRVDFNFLGRPECRGSLVGMLPGTIDWAQPAASIDCPRPATSGQEMPETDSPIRMEIVRATLELTIVFADLVGLPAEMLKPGAELEELRAVTVDYQLAGLASDTAPDYRDPGLRYTI
jgi:RNA polymerase sigma factor (sigma-70 family)